MYALSQLFNEFCILYKYLYIFVMNIIFQDGECVLTKISYHLRVLWISHFKGLLYLSSNKLSGTLPTEMGNLNELGKLLCTHSLNSLIVFLLCRFICISMFWKEYLKMERVNWPQYLNICKFSDFLTSKWNCILQLTT